jgi:hypothetical protein
MKWWDKGWGLTMTIYELGQALQDVVHLKKEAGKQDLRGNKKE